MITALATIFVFGLIVFIHELGHFILQHDGNYFTESIDNQENLLEREANIFSAVVLMPDIVLLSKIYYSFDTFFDYSIISSI